MPRAVIADDERLMREQLRARLGEVWPAIGDRGGSQERHGSRGLDRTAPPGHRVSGHSRLASLGWMRPAKSRSYPPLTRPTAGPVAKSSSLPPTTSTPYKPSSRAWWTMS